MFTLEHVALKLLKQPEPGRFFSAPERRALAATAELLLEDSVVRISAEEVVQNVDTFFAAGRSRRAWRVRALCQLVEIIPLSLPEYRRTFSRLTRAQRIALINERFVGGRHLFGICANIRLIAYMGLYGDARAERPVGFVPVPERARTRKERSGRSTARIDEDRAR